MSPRVTRSAARLQADAGGLPSLHSTTTGTHAVSRPAASSTVPPSRKRRAYHRDHSPDQLGKPTAASVGVADSSRRRTKRAKVEDSVLPTVSPLAPVATSRRRKGKATPAMSSTGPSPQPFEDSSTPLHTPSVPSNKRRQSRRETQEISQRAEASSQGRSKRRGDDEDTEMQDVMEKEIDKGVMERNESVDTNNDESGPSNARRYLDNDDDPFDGGFGGHSGGPIGLSRTLRHLSGMMSGITSRFRGLLEQLRQKDDPSVQLIALQELSELLLVSNEDNLAGHFTPDAYVKELVTLMQPDEFGEENPEMMLLACRCIANLMEALPQATPSVVYGGAVPVLCQKLLEIHYIDLAEQALSTLEKISLDFPASIVREGGLVACLQYMDFFATSTQRTAVTTAANCCRNIPDDSFPTIRDVMPILLNVLNSNDQKVVEQGCLCVCRIVESFKHHYTKLEELISPDLLKAILRLLLPGTTNLIGPNIHTQFLRVLTFTTRASAQLCVELFKMNVVDTLYQILTGVSPPNKKEDPTAKLDSVLIMQALIHRPREQIFETLNVICELLPEIPTEGLLFFDDLLDPIYMGDEYTTKSKKSQKDKRERLLSGCKDDLKRFAMILFPTLTNAYSSTVNLSVRQKVLTAQLKMLSNLGIDILADAIRTVPYASFLASILSQQDHPTLVTFALQAAELLLKRLEQTYRYQFYREGVISEISKLADRQVQILEEKLEGSSPTIESARQSTGNANSGCAHVEAVGEDQDDDYQSNEEENEDDDEDNDDDDMNDENDNENSESDSSDDSERDYTGISAMSNFQDVITLQAKKFLHAHEGGPGSKDMRAEADKIMANLTCLANNIKDCYLNHSPSNSSELFKNLAKHFDTDALESVTSYELLTSGIVSALLEVFSMGTTFEKEARSSFLQAFMCPATPLGTSLDFQATAFSILISKLHDLLSRAEHFEVLTVHYNSYDSNRTSAASMLAKQLRLKLLADDESGIPRGFSNIQVSIHAIATFRALDEYLRPRIALGEPKISRRTGLSSVMAANAAALADRRLNEGRTSLPQPTSTSSESASKLGTKRSDRSKSKQSSSSTLAVNETSTESSSSGSKAHQMSSAMPPWPAGVTTTRRPSRRSKSQLQSAPPPPPPPPARTPTNDENLECADEAPLSDDDTLAADDTLNALVDDLEDEMTDARDESDPSAVNMEVASTGKVTARTDDGQRVSTPLAGMAAGTNASLLEASRARLAVAERILRGTDTSSSRPMSYASALQLPIDWHLEFSINGHPISNETTIYRAVHFNQAHPSEVSSRNIWSTTHAIQIKKVPGAPPVDFPHLRNTSESSPPSTVLPISLDKNPTTSSILRLLGILHEMNAHIEEVIYDKTTQAVVSAEPLSQFVNTKLTAKLNRQLEEPLIVASNCLPTWSVDLARLYPFLFPFETRHLFLQSTSFGYARSMSRWQNAHQSSDTQHPRHRDERPFLGRLQRQKVRISRTRILESAVKVMELYGSSSSILEVEYFEEVGTGLGPTLEFYSTVSKEFSKKKLKLWRENESNVEDEYAFGMRGLFPAPMSEDMAHHENGARILNLFKMLGKFVARSMLDSRIVDVPFNPTFFRASIDSKTLTSNLAAVKSVDSGLADSLRFLQRFVDAKKYIDEDPNMSAAQKVRSIQNIQIDDVKVDHLALDFTLPGYPSIELKPQGSLLTVTIDNVAEYINKVVDFTLDIGVQRQIDAFRSGFGQVFPYSALRAFTPDELVMLFGRVEEDWTLETLMDSIKADHGFNLDSKSVRNLLQVMSELSTQQRRDFLQFVTGSPKLPIGGFKSLTPMFTVVCKPSEAPYTSDDYLPSVMTCVNYLKLPDYSSIDVLKEKLFLAIREGQGAFHLS